MGKKLIIFRQNTFFLFKGNFIFHIENKRIRLTRVSRKYSETSLFVNFYLPLMKVRLVKKKSIENFVLQHADSRSPFSRWLALLKWADWKTPADIAATYGSADLLGNNSNRVVFNIGGNNYRMICKYHLGIKNVHLYVKWIGTHAAYTQLCKDNRQYTINIY